MKKGKLEIEDNQLKEVNKTQQKQPNMQLKENDRIELIQDIGKFPHYRIRKGLKGTVTLVDDEKIVIQTDKTLKAYPMYQDKTIESKYWKNKFHIYYEEIFYTNIDKYIKKID